MAGAALGGVLALVLALGACGRSAPPPAAAQLESLQASLAEANAARLAPAEYGAFLARLSRARVDLEAGRAFPWGLFPDRRLERELANIAAEGTPLLGVVGERAQERRQATRVRLALVRERVGLLLRAREVVGGSAGAGGDLARLEVLAAEAEGYSERGDDDRAATAAERAAHLLARQEADWARELERYADPGTVAGWGKLVRDLIRWSASRRAPAIAVSKADLRLTVYLGGRSVAAYRVTLGINGFRQKLHAGDGATPEGRYRVTKRGSGETRYHKALLLDYPNAEDRRRFVARRGAGALPGRVGLGGLIEIHGGVADEAGRTLGCIGLANRDMDAVFERVTTGTPVVIVGAASRDNAVAHLFAELGNGKHTDGSLGH